MKKNIDSFCIEICKKISFYLNTFNINVCNIKELFILYYTSNNINTNFDKNIDDLFKASIESYNSCGDIKDFDVIILIFIIQRYYDNDNAQSNYKHIINDLDRDYFKHLTQIKSSCNSEQFAYPLIYYYIRTTFTNLSNDKFFLEECVLDILNNISKDHVDNIYKLAQDVDFHLLDYNYLILNTLVELAKNEVFNQKAKRMLREYEQILISIVPQLCYNKLLYIITLSRINSILKSNKIQRHIKAILISITDDELLDEFNSNNMNFCAGAIGELLILKYISRDQLYIDDNLSYIKFTEIIPKNEKKLMEYIKNLNISLSKRESNPSILEIKKCSNIAFELLLLRNIY